MCAGCNPVLTDNRVIHVSTTAKLAGRIDKSPICGAETVLLDDTQ